MKITKLELTNFKRFDHLTIDLTSLTEPAKLVLLIGTNGSGKSSVFDAFEAINKHSKHETIGKYEVEYYKKNRLTNYKIRFNNAVGEEFNFLSGSYLNAGFQNSFYGRTSIRQIPRLTRTALGQGAFSFENDSDRPKTFIDRDNRFENDIENVASSILTDVFKGNSSTEQIIESYVNPINKSFDNIFNIDESTKIELISIKPPLEGKTAEILFKKGNSQILYDYLSSGEKEIFNILLNLLTRKDYFRDAIYFLDEIDLHLNTFLQKNLLKEITENWIPDNCQLWTASHSLGFIEYANESQHAAIVDFDNLNFDAPQVILPSQKNNFDVFEIAVSKEFLANLFEGKKIIFSENSDTPLYNNLSIDNTVFFNARDKADVFYKTKNNSTYYGLVDRDYLTNEERTDIASQYKNLFILKYYSIENYLFHPDNLEEYYRKQGIDFDKNHYANSVITEWVKIKDKILIGILGARNGYPYHRENESDAKLKAFKSNTIEILQMFSSPDFETFYKIFPAKDYATELRERQNLNRIELAKTDWFKNNIREVLIK